MVNRWGEGEQKRCTAKSRELQPIHLFTGLCKHWTRVRKERNAVGVDVGDGGVDAVEAAIVDVDAYERKGSEVNR